MYSISDLYLYLNILHDTVRLMGPVCLIESRWAIKTCQHPCSHNGRALKPSLRLSDTPSSGDIFVNVDILSGKFGFKIDALQNYTEVKTAAVKTCAGKYTYTYISEYREQLKENMEDSWVTSRHAYDEATVTKIQ